jgi:hypothetical protein
MSTLRIYETNAELYSIASSIFDLRNVTVQNVVFTTNTQSSAF